MIRNICAHPVLLFTSEKKDAVTDWNDNLLLQGKLSLETALPS
jgi:hypothetical protein